MSNEKGRPFFVGLGWCAIWMGMLAGFLTDELGLGAMGIALGLLMILTEKKVI